MSIIASVKDMESTINSRTQMLYQDAEIEYVNDLAVRVMSIDPVTFEYAITDGYETFRTYNRNVFVMVLGSELIQ